MVIINIRMEIGIRLPLALKLLGTLSCKQYPFPSSVLSLCLFALKVFLANSKIAVREPASTTISQQSHADIVAQVCFALVSLCDRSPRAI